MRIAWLIGTVFSKEMISSISKEQKGSGGWVYTQIQYLLLDENVDILCVISVCDDYSRDSSFECGNLKVYQIKDNPIRLRINRNTFDKIDKVLIENRIELLDVQGTETALSTYPAYNSTKTLTINTLHGIAYQCYRFYSIGLPAGFLLFRRNLHDIITLHGVWESKLLMKRRAKMEENLFQHIKYVRGRTKWDYQSVVSVNQKIKYYHAELIMRDLFYQHEWRLESARRNRIFTSQMRIPYKGMFILLEAIYEVKKIYPDIEIHIPGNSIRRGFKRNGYEKYIFNKIKELGLEKNIVLLGNLNADEMTQELLEARVFVMPSIIENSPNSLAEAQLIGTPSVSSLVGGVSDYITNGISGLMYNSLDPIMCAQAIIRLLSDSTLSESISLNERKIAKKRHNPHLITNSIVKCYSRIIEEERKEYEESNNL